MCKKIIIGIMCGFLLLTGSIIWFYLTNIYPTSLTQDEQCQKMGFNKSTDYKSTGIWRWSLECDYKSIVHVSMYLNSHCIEYNKWGDCKEKESIVEYSFMDAINFTN